VRLRAFACLLWVAGTAALAPGHAAARADVAPSLTLEVARNPVVGQPTGVTATGTAPSGYSIWMFVDPNSTVCPPDPDARPPGAISVASALPVGESFSVLGLYRPTHTGQQSFCAYLRRSASDAAVAAIEVRTVLEPLLPPTVARHTVVAALRRHGFAERVIGALESRCHRHSRTKFVCRFKARFRGYDLKGHGRVARRGGELSYRFRVTAQGERFLLTQRNEGQLPM
jgi:hypothetical protein